MKLRKRKSYVTKYSLHGLYSPTNMQKHQTNLNNMITLRVKDESIKMESFGSQKYDADNFAMHKKFCYIAKFCCDSEISTYSENFAMHRKFLYHSEIST